MNDSNLLALYAFVSAASFVLLVFTLVNGRRNRLASRLQDLSRGEGGSPQTDGDAVAQLARTALPKMGVPLLPQDQQERTRLQTRLYHAGYYSRQAMLLFLGVKMLLIVAPAILGVLAGLAGLVAIENGLIGGAMLGIVGMVGPSFWLDRRKRGRQIVLRRALPDALDVLVICLEGGLSLPSALKRVGEELRTAHPDLALELNIVQREIQLGRSTGEALRQFAERTDLEELRMLSSLILQSERFGASLVKALRVHADGLRQKRLFYAEEMAQKAATKILFPTVLFILPGMFIVILGPAALQIIEMFSHMSGLP
jgi:tight adherence protein C